MINKEGGAGLSGCHKLLEWVQFPHYYLYL